MFNTAFRLASSRDCSDKPSDAAIPSWFAARDQAGLFARCAVYRAREERAASKHWASEARAKAERAKRALGKGTAVAGDLCKQAEAVGCVWVSLRSCSSFVVVVVVAGASVPLSRARMCLHTWVWFYPIYMRRVQKHTMSQVVAVRSRPRSCRPLWSNAAPARIPGLLDVVDARSMTHQARSAANEALKLLVVLSRPTVKAAGRLQKRLVIEEGGHDREQVHIYPQPLGACFVPLLSLVHPSLAPFLRSSLPSLPFPPLPSLSRSRAGCMECVRRFAESDFSPPSHR